MAPSAKTNTMLVTAVPLMLHWMAPLGDSYVQRAETAKESLNRACQLFSVHGIWSWIPKVVCLITRALVAMQSEVAAIDNILPSAWDYGRRSQPALAAMADMSADTASLWLLEVNNAADFLGTFATFLLSKDVHQTWGTIQHAADGCLDLAELIKAFIFHHPDQHGD